MAENLWLDEGPPSGPRRPRRRRAGMVAGAAACLVVVLVPVALVAGGGPRPGADGARSPHPGRSGHAPSAPVLLGALNATTGSGNFDVTYIFGGQGATTATTTTTTSSGCGAPGAVRVSASEPLVSSSVAIAGPPSVICASGPPVGSQPVTGTATIDLVPFAMVATSAVSGLGTVVLRDDGTDVWEQGGGDYGLSPGSSASGPGSSLTGFAGLVEGTLGPRQGPLAMLGLASPTGYLNLDPAETSSADLVGTSTVAGVPVDVYQIVQTPAQVAQPPGLTDQEQQAVAAAMHLLVQQGYTGSTVLVSVDGAGFIRRTQTTDHFADGTTMTSEAEFSNFGCAGTVLMPGQSGSSTPPTGCTSPDVPTATTAPSSTAPPTTVPPTTVPPTTVPPTTVPATTVPVPGPAAPPSSTTSSVPTTGTNGPAATPVPPSTSTPPHT